MTLWLDSTMFNGDEVMFTRLKYMYKYVDRFFISEQKFTHTGMKKDVLYIDTMKARFAPYLDKITFITDHTQVQGAWANENNMRNYPRQKILEMYPNEPFILSVCDCDEIPDVSVVKKDELHDATSDGCMYMKQTFHYYNLNWYIGDWTMPFFVNDVLLKNTESVQIFRNRSGPVAGMIPCGWHLSYFMSVKDIHRKIVSFAHEELNKEESRSYENIIDAIRRGKDLFHRQDTLLSPNKETNYPPELMELHSIILQQQTPTQSQKYTAVIVETREHKALPFVLQNFLENLSDEWTFILFCGNLNKTFCIDQVRSLSTSRIRIVNMGVDTMVPSQYSTLLTTNQSFYSEIKTEHFLMFQTDSMIFPRCRDNIKEFFQYDYVGAPWDNIRYGGVGNGGLSLRRKTKMLEIIDTVKYCGEPEDIYFCHNILVPMHRPTMEAAGRFSVEEVFHPNSFGCHKPWGRGFDAKLFATYPEVAKLYELNDIVPQLA